MMTSREREILIIGGGIAGTSAAYHLAQYGHDVALLERGNIASGASGVNAGNIGAMGWGHNPGLFSHLTMGSLEIFKAIQLDLGYEIEFRQSGSLEAVHTEAQYSYARDTVLRLKSEGYAVELLTSKEARGIEPEMNSDLPGFIYTPTRAQADPVKATRAFAAAAEVAGAAILTGHEVIAIQIEDSGRYRLETAQGIFLGDSLVIAAGAWCGPVGEMLGLGIDIVPVRGQMWATAPAPPTVFQTISSAESHYQWDREPHNDPASPLELTHRGNVRVTRHLYGRQTRSGEIIFGGDRQLAGYSQVAQGSGIEVNRGHATEILPVLRHLPVKRVWAGLMPFSLDGLPVIGRVPGMDNLFIASGLCSSGFGRGPMAGKLLADYFHSGYRPPVLEEADPYRCVSANR